MTALILLEQPSGKNAISLSKYPYGNLTFVYNVDAVLLFALTLPFAPRSTRLSCSKMLLKPSRASHPVIAIGKKATHGLSR
jgi:hypothetical protein